MEDKTFALLTRLYGEFSEFRNEITEKVEENSKHILRLEDDLNKKTSALFDGYKQIYEKLQEHDKRFDALERNMEKQDVEIHVIKGGK